MPELFPGEKEQVDGIEVAHEAQTDGQLDPRADSAFLDDGSITLYLDSDDSEDSVADDGAVPGDGEIGER